MNYKYYLLNFPNGCCGGSPCVKDQWQLQVDGPGSLQLSGDHILAVPLHHALSGGGGGEAGDHEGQGELEEAVHHVWGN